MIVGGFHLREKRIWLIYETLNSRYSELHKSSASSDIYDSKVFFSKLIEWQSKKNCNYFDVY